MPPVHSHKNKNSFFLKYQPTAERRTPEQTGTAQISSDGDGISKNTAKNAPEKSGGVLFCCIECFFTTPFLITDVINVSSVLEKSNLKTEENAGNQPEKRLFP